MKEELRIEKGRERVFVSLPGGMDVLFVPSHLREGGREGGMGHRRGMYQLYEALISSCHWQAPIFLPSVIKYAVS